MSKKFHIKKGDLVQVNAGEDRGKQGKVLEIIKKEAPIHISNLNVVDPVTGKPTKVGRRRNAEGKLVRYAKKSGQELK